MPFGAGGAAWWSCACATSVTLLGLPCEVRDELVELRGRDLRPQRRRHRGREARRDVGVGLEDRLADEGVERAAVRGRRLLLQVVEVGADLPVRARRGER